MVIVEKLVDWRLAAETEVLGENLPQRHFVHHKSHMTKRGGKSATNRLSYGASLTQHLRWGAHINHTTLHDSSRQAEIRHPDLPNRNQEW
jgi:hypothetical protein